MNTLSENYTFEITGDDSTQLIVLTQVATGKKKEFPLVAKSVKALTEQMSSYTEDICKDYFKGIK